MTTTAKTPVREPAGTGYSSTALYQCPNDGTVKCATITHAYARNYSTANTTITIANVDNPGTAPVPGTDESSTNEYYKETVTANNGVLLNEMIGQKLLPGEFINEKAGAANSIIVTLSVIEELN